MDNFTEAVNLHRQGRLTEAESLYRLALNETPDHADAHNNLGVLLRRLGRISEATGHLEEALRLRPDYAEALSNLGAVLCDEGRLDEAEAALRLALRLKPEYASAYNNLGNLLMARRRVAAAEAAYAKAIASSPGHAEAHWNRALARLLEGNFIDGWQEYEWRLQRPDAGYPAFSEPTWRGEPLGGRRILVWAEQGMGDTIQFVRLVPFVAEKGARVILRCQRGLGRLLNSVPGIERVVEEGEPLPPFDIQCPLLSLPLLLGIDSEQKIPAKLPYLAVDRSLVDAWDARLPKGDRLRVGLVWAGAPRPNEPDSRLIDRRRSMDFASMAPLLQVPGIDFYSLQKGEAAQEAQGRLIDLMDEAKDFADTTALISHLDLVIGVDTAVIHAAGALGKPVWLLSRYDGCWRWLLERDDSPWYPGMRIYRQSVPGAWIEVIQQVANNLARQSQPGNAEAHNNLGVRHLKHRRLAQAAGEFSHAIAIAPGMAMAHFNLGVALRELEHPEEAAASFRQAVALVPDFVEAHVSLGMALLSTGKLAEGFVEYEWRARLAPSRYEGLSWDGLIRPGGTLLIRCEQGLGDTIQFVRYLPFIAQQGMRIAVQCPPALRCLLQSVEGVTAVVGFDEKPPAFDAHCSLLSLPHLFRTTLESIPVNVPYLGIREEFAAIWQERLVPYMHTIKIGLCWRGNTHYGGDRERSIDLAEFGRLADIPGVTWISLLDRAPREEEIPVARGMNLVDVSEHLTDLTETAALLGQLDMVISVDTAMAHLAGALGRPVWTLIRHAPDWRWMLDRDDSPWYPTMRLFRQRRPGDWGGMLAQIEAALRGVMASIPKATD